MDDRGRDRRDPSRLALDVARAKAGDREALESVVRAVQPEVYALALRFLWHPQDAEDATQEILIRVVTRLGSFAGESAFRTWVYRVASNALITSKKKRMEERTLTFAEFGADLARGLEDRPSGESTDPDEVLLLEEVKIGCTLGLLLCLDRGHRIAYILGEILELEHQEAAEALEISPAAFRKRLSRARERISTFMASRCGLANPANPCRCRKRVDAAISLGRVDPARLLFAGSREQARRFPIVLDEIRRLEETRRAAALYRSHPVAPAKEELMSWLANVVAESREGLRCP